MDAGRSYNTFPLMGGRIVPEEYWNIAGWRNFFENTAAVQFDHRVLAISTLTGVAALWAAHRGAPLPRAARTLLHATAAMTAAQVRARSVRASGLAACGCMLRSFYGLLPELLAVMAAGTTAGRRLGPFAIASCCKINAHPSHQRTQP